MDSIQCSALTKNGRQCSRFVKAEFGPVYCLHRRNNLTPSAACAFIMDKEGELCTILRDMEWLDLVLHKVRQMQQQTRLAGVTANTGRLTIEPVEELVPYGGYREPMSPTGSDDSL